MKQKILLALKSRTAWTAVLMFVVNGLQGIKPLLSPQWMSVVDAMLTVLIVLFHVNPSQNYQG